MANVSSCSTFATTLTWHLNSWVIDAETEAEQHFQGHLASMWPSRVWNPGLLSSRAHPPHPAQQILFCMLPNPTLSRDGASIILCPWLITLSLGPGGRAETREAAGFGALGEASENTPFLGTKKNTMLRPGATPCSVLYLTGAPTTENMVRAQQAVRWEDGRSKGRGRGLRSQGNQSWKDQRVWPHAFVFTGRETEAQGGEGTHPRPRVSLRLCQDSIASPLTPRLAFLDLEERRAWSTHGLG